MEHTVVLIHPTIHQAGVDYLKERCKVVMAPDGKESTLIPLKDFAISSPNLM